MSPSHLYPVDTPGQPWGALALGLRGGISGARSTNIHPDSPRATPEQGIAA